MKITFDIECTPEDARTFLGLPDAQPMQKAMMDQLQRRLEQTIQAMDPETLVNMWLPMGLHSLEQINKSFWSQVNTAMTQTAGTTTPAKDRKKT